MIDYNEFAQKIKQKYPEHQEEDNLSLTKRYLDQYPVYKNRVSLETPQQQGGLGESIVSNLPTIGAAGFGIPGFFAGGPLGAGVGAAAGGVTGKSLQNIIRYFQGQKQTPAGNLMSALQAGKESGITGLGLGMLGGAAKVGLQPGATRQSVIENLPEEQQNIPEKVVRSRLSDILQKAFTTDVQENLSSLKTNLLSKLFPMKTTEEMKAAGESGINLNKLYEELGKLEKETRSYGSQSPVAQAGKLLSTEMRSLANEYGGLPVQLLNKYMSLGYKLRPSLGTVGKMGAGLGGASLGLKWLMDQLKDVVSQ